MTYLNHIKNAKNATSIQLRHNLVVDKFQVSKYLKNGQDRSIQKPEKAETLRSSFRLITSFLRNSRLITVVATSTIALNVKGDNSSY